jgi:bifunctional UDP-N-acetylglucosamine pyrophosphorylase / glucosamine-1-phosphate N-acetyltransferase
LKERTLNRLMASGVTIVDPATTFIHPEVKIGQDTVIRPCTVIEKDVVIGRRCGIGPFCRIRPGTRIADNVELGNFIEVSRSHVGAKTTAKHFSFLGDARNGQLRRRK